MSEEGTLRVDCISQWLQDLRTVLVCVFYRVNGAAQLPKHKGCVVFVVLQTKISVCLKYRLAIIISLVFVNRSITGG